MSAPGTSGLSVAGEMGSEELVALQKALTAGYGSDTNGLTGGSAFRIQSLDTTLKATVQENKHFALFNALAKPKATAVVDEWTEQDSIGGFLGGTFNDQDGAASETNGSYTRRTAQGQVHDHVPQDPDRPAVAEQHRGCGERRDRQWHQAAADRHRVQPVRR